MAGKLLPLSEYPMTPASFSTIGISWLTVDVGRHGLAADGLARGQGHVTHVEHAEQSVRDGHLRRVVGVVHGHRISSASNA